MNIDRDVIAAGELNELFRDLPTTVTRKTIWGHVLGVISRHQVDRAQVVLRLPDTLELVADTRGTLHPGAAIPDQDVVEWCFVEKQARFMPSDTGSGPRGAGMVALLPLLERGEVAAVLRIERQGPLKAGDFEDLTSLAFAVSACLTDRSWALEAALTADLSSRLAAVDDLSSGASAALNAIVPAVGASGGLLLEARAGHLLPIADYGRHAVERREISAIDETFTKRLSWQAFQKGELRFARDYSAHPDHVTRLPTDPVVIAVPLERQGAARSILIVTYGEGHVPAEADLIILRGGCDALSGLLGRLREAQTQDRLFGVLGPLLDAPVEDLYQQVLDIAVECVPGAQKGSLLVRDTRDAEFTFRAVVGYDLDEIAGPCVTDKGLLDWYAPEAKSWGVGEPRILTASTDHLLLRRWSADVGSHIGEAGCLEDIKANLCVPVLVGGDIHAVLNLDNLVREDAFGRDSIRLAHQVAMTATTILRIAVGHAIMQADAVIDPVTKLLNRRGAEMELERALARAMRDDEPLSVLVMGMGGFKSLTDALGPAVSDQTMRLVARTLQRDTRAGDVVARWGSDAFIAILPRQASKDANHTIRRLALAVENLRGGKQRLSIHIGAGSFPTDAVTADDLLATADQRSYDVKEGSRNPA